MPYASDYISADIVETVVTVENTDNVLQIESLKAENKRLHTEINNAKRRLHWCEKDIHNHQLSFQKKIAQLSAKSSDHKIEQLDDQNVSLKSQISKYEQELLKVKQEYGVIFDLLNKTHHEASNELDHYLAHTREVMNFAGNIRSENQDLIHTISKLREMLGKYEQLPPTIIKRLAPVTLSNRAPRIPTAKSQVANVLPSTETGIVASFPNVRTSQPRSTTSKNRKLRPKKRSITNAKVEEHPRTMNKTHVASTIDVASGKCNRNSDVTNAKPLSTFDIQSDAPCVICRKSMLFDCHDKCVARAILSHLRILRIGIPLGPLIILSLCLVNRPL